MTTRSLVLPAACAALLIAFHARGESPHAHPRPATPPPAPASASASAHPTAPAASGGGNVRTTSAPRHATSGGYRRFTFDEPLADWRQVNDTVRTIGGWRAYAQEAARANAPTAQPQADTIAPLPAPASKEKP